MSQLGSILKSNKENNETLDAAAKANLAAILEGNKTKAEAHLKKASTQKQNEKFFETAVSELLLDTQFNLFKIECTRQAFAGKEEIYIEFRNDMNITGKLCFDDTAFQKILMKPQGKEFINWLKENSLKLKVCNDHDGVGVSSWASLEITPI